LKQWLYPESVRPGGSGALFSAARLPVAREAVDDAGPGGIGPSRRGLAKILKSNAVRVLGLG
jgi:hypothetical protein